MNRSGGSTVKGNLTLEKAIVLGGDGGEAIGQECHGSLLSVEPKQDGRSGMVLPVACTASRWSASCTIATPGSIYSLSLCISSVISPLHHSAILPYPILPHPILPLIASYPALPCPRIHDLHSQHIRSPHLSQLIHHHGLLILLHHR